MLPEWFYEQIIKRLEGLRFLSSWSIAAYGWSYRVMGRRLFVAVGLIVCLWATLDFAVLKQSKGIEDRTFDEVMQMRWNEPKASREIVIATIDEKSLSEMSGEFGRWPWPRELFGDFINRANQAGVKAIVFDILFSDSDKFNLASDERFNEALADAPNVFLPVIRLDSEADRQSQLMASRIPGLQKLSEAPKDKAVGLVWPAFLPAALANANFGSINLYPSSDGITRDYHLYSDEGGYRLPSMALKVAEDVGEYTFNPHQKQIRINWRGKKSDYTQVPFSELYASLKTGEQKARASLENKILIIGVTAPALFDQKAVPIANVYPGVKIVANALDNLLNNDSIRLMPSWAAYLIAIGFVTLLCTLLALGIRTQLLDKLFGSFQLLFLGITLTVINYFPYYIDLSMPFYYGLTAYALMRTYIMASHQYALGKGIFKPHLPDTGPFEITVAHLRLDYTGSDKRKECVLMELALETVKEMILRHRLRMLLNDRPMEEQGLFTKLFENRIFILNITTEGTVAKESGARPTWADGLMEQIQMHLKKIRCPVVVTLEALQTEHDVSDKSEIFHSARRLLGQVLITGS